MWSEYYVVQCQQFWVYCWFVFVYIQVGGCQVVVGQCVGQCQFVDDVVVGDVYQGCCWFYFCQCSCIDDVM